MNRQMKRKSKYQAKGNWQGGRFYGSQLERDFGDILGLMQKAGEIKAFIHQPPAVQFPCGIKWRIDYLVTDNNRRQYYIETKGMGTEAYRLQLKCFKHHKPKPLFVIGRKGTSWYIIDQVNTERIQNPLTTF